VWGTFQYITALKKVKVGSLIVDRNRLPAVNFHDLLDTEPCQTFLEMSGF